MKIFTPVIAADTLHYLTGAVHFMGDTWDGYSKWVHFSQGEGVDATVYDIALTDDAWDETVELNLTVGEWNVYITGTKDSSRLTTVPLILTVKASGLVDAPLHVMPLSVAEQIDSKANTALTYAAEVKAAYEAGELNGEDGKSFTIQGYYDTYADLLAAVPTPSTGEAYGIGMNSTTHGRTTAQSAAPRETRATPVLRSHRAWMQTGIFPGRTTEGRKTRRHGTLRDRPARPDLPARTGRVLTRLLSRRAIPAQRQPSTQRWPRCRITMRGICRAEQIPSRYRPGTLQAVQ